MTPPPQNPISPDATSGAAPDSAAVSAAPAHASMPDMPPTAAPDLMESTVAQPEADTPVPTAHSHRPEIEEIRAHPLGHRPPGVEGGPRLLARRLGPAAETCRIHWSGWVAVIPFAVLSLLNSGSSASARGMGPGATVGFMFANVMWGLVAACAVAWVAWRLHRHTHKTATIAFLSALVLIGASGAWGTANRKSANENAVRAIRAKASAEVATAGRKSQVATDHAFDCLKADGGLSLRGVTTIAQIDRRLGLFDDVLRAVREARESPQAIHARLHAELAAARLPLWQQTQVLADFRDEVNWDADRRIGDATERLLMAGRNQLRFVRDQWGTGKIKIDRQTGQCSFQDKKAAERFKQLATEVLTANAALRAAVQEAVNQVEAKAGSGAGPGRPTGAVAGGVHELAPAVGN